MATHEVLVVDDDDAIRTTLCELLEFEGYLVRGAANGRDALQEIDRCCPQLVILDMQMPVMDGWGLACALQADGVAVPILVLTAAVDGHRRAMEIEAAGWIAKPFEIGPLLAEVERLCAPQAHDGTRRSGVR